MGLFGRFAPGGLIVPPRLLGWGDEAQKKLKSVCVTSVPGAGHFLHWSGSAGLGFQKGNLRSRFPVVFDIPFKVADPRIAISVNRPRVARNPRQ